MNLAEDHRFDQAVGMRTQTLLRRESFVTTRGGGPAISVHRCVRHGNHERKWILGIVGSTGDCEHGLNGQPKLITDLERRWGKALDRHTSAVWASPLSIA